MSHGFYDKVLEFHDMVMETLKKHILVCDFLSYTVSYKLKILLLLTFTKFIFHNTKQFGAFF